MTKSQLLSLVVFNNELIALDVDGNLFKIDKDWVCTPIHLKEPPKPRKKSFKAPTDKEWL